MASVAAMVPLPVPGNAAQAAAARALSSAGGGTHSGRQNGTAEAAAHSTAGAAAEPQATQIVAQGSLPATQLVPKSEPIVLPAQAEPPGEAAGYCGCQSSFYIHQPQQKAAQIRLGKRAPNAGPRSLNLDHGEVKGLRRSKWAFYMPL